jgi:putative membrane protein
MANPNPTPDASKLGTVRTYILIAFIFAIIIMIGWLLAGISYIITFATFSSLTFGYGFGFFSGIFLVYAVVFFVLMAVSVIVFLRIWKMWKAVNAGDIATLKATSNMMWAIIALIFAGVIPGIMLIIADGPIKQL